MLKVNPIYAVIGAFALVSVVTIVFLNHKVDSLTTELTTVKQVAKNNAEALDSFKIQYESIKTMTYKNQALVEQIKAENEKLRKDAKKSSVVAKKPGLVENQINKSFNAYAEDLRKLSE
ncbi:spanin Rz [Escherichia phage vB_EcoM_ESCO47]|nr:spanin Rz [Escherichia phage vB_EcoM_ESCO47]